jgi:hypothetical protein
MTSITVALVVLAAGWIFARLWLRTRYMALKEAGHPQYFSAAVAGVFLLLLGASMHAWASSAFPAWYPTLDGVFLSVLPEGDEKSSGMTHAQLVAFASCATWSLFLAGLLPWLLNIPLQSNARLLRATMKRAGAFDAVEHITSHALDCGILVALTLKNKKVYVGNPVSLSTLDIERKWLVLIPVLSGYRNDPDMTFDLPTNYGEVYQKIFRDRPEDAPRLIGEFRVVLAVSEVVSIGTFNVNTYYERFKQKKELEAQKATANTEPAIGSQVEDGTGDDVSEVDDVEAPPDDAGTDEDGEDLMPKAPSGLSQEERSRSARYYGYVGLLALAVLAMPYSVPTAGVLAFVSGLFAVASCHAGASVEHEADD